MLATYPRLGWCRQVTYTVPAKDENTFYKLSSSFDLYDFANAKFHSSKTKNKQERVAVFGYNNK